MKKTFRPFSKSVAWLRRHPKITGTFATMVIANEIRGIIMVLIYLNVFQWAVP